MHSVQKSWGGLRWFGVITVLLVLVGALVACGEEEAPVGAGGEADMEETELDDVAGDPDAYVGQTVTVSGEVSEVLSPNMFRINNDEVLDIGDEVLVVHTGQEAATELVEETEVLVTGVVHRFTVAEIEDDLGIDLGLDEDVEVEYENRPALVATGIDALEADD